MTDTIISLTFTPKQILFLKTLVGDAPSSTEGQELFTRINTSIDARDFFDALDDDQRGELLASVVFELDEADLLDYAPLVILTDPDINEMTNYIDIEED